MRTLQVALVGNPNCGKTALFNALTSQHRRVGNFPGITVELCYGFCSLADSRVAQLIDLPGCYSSILGDEEGPEDERLACRSLESLAPDIWLNVVDACHVQRHLYLTLQLLESGRPMIVVLNRMDLAAKQGLTIDVEALEQLLGVLVIPTAVTRYQGLERLRAALEQPLAPCRVQPGAYLPAELHLGEDLLASLGCSKWFFWRAMEGDVRVIKRLSALQASQVSLASEALRCRLGEEAAVCMADARYRALQLLVDRVMQGQFVGVELGERLDRWLLHPFWGMLAFLVIMYGTFWVTIGVGGLFQDWIARVGDLWLVQGLGAWLASQGLPRVFNVMISQGVGVGWVTTWTFMPLIGFLFMALTVLEDSGYMARAVFLMDQWMVRLGLPGRSFVAMVMGLGCNVPGVMAARTCSTRKERIMTAMMAPFMSCGARLTLYTVLIGAFFPTGGYRVVFLLYLMGLLMAVFTGWVLRHTLLPGALNQLVMELPTYQRPQWSHVWRQGWRQAMMFFRRGIRWVIPVTVVISLLTDLPWTGAWSHVLIALRAGGEWLLSPFGLHADNWPAMVGLVTGVVAKEVVVSTLNTLYLPGVTWVHDLSWQQLWQQTCAHTWHMGQVLLGVASDDDAQLMQPLAYHVMVKRFGDAASAFSYCVFVLLYMPCVSTLAAIGREISRGWALFSLLWSLVLAYVAAVWCYQISHFLKHPHSSLVAMLASGVVLGMMFACLVWTERRRRQRGSSGNFV